MGYISVPYLPKGKVTLAVGSFGAPGMALIRPPKLNALPDYINRHADLGLCPVGGCEVVCPPDSHSYFAAALEPYGFSVICGGQALGGSYPADTAYNVVVAGKFAIVNPKACDPVLMKILGNRFEIAPVRQGYAKCAVCPVDESSLITADESIRRRAEALGLEVLKISGEGVSLPPFESGFFGGASGLVAENVLAVNGSLSKMKSGAEIKSFLKGKNIRILELSPAQPFDTGSLIPLMTTDDNK